jgi:peptidoglycan/LPS O-acetylase OafA/YrhL
MPETSHPATRDLSGIQILRFLAAFAIVVLHATTRADLIVHRAWKAPDDYVLTAGVDLFFVISGFIMVHIMKPEPRPIEFAAQRLFRVMPIYWFWTAVAIVLTNWLTPGYSLPPKDVGQTISGIFLLPTLVKPLLGVGWTPRCSFTWCSPCACLQVVAGPWRLSRSWCPSSCSAGPSTMFPNGCTTTAVRACFSSSLSASLPGCS